MNYSQAGHDLAHWNLNYEKVDKYPAKLDNKIVAAALPEQDID